MNINITSDWQIEGNSNISSSVQYINEVENVNFLELLDEDICFSLNRPISMEALDCSPHINIVVDGISFTSLVLISEAKYVEVYLNSYKEYFSTFHGELLSEFNDSKIYKTVIHLKEQSTFLELRLKGIFNLQSVWVYGIFAEMGSDTGSVSTEPISMYNRANLLLREKDIKISKNAEKFKQFWGEYTIHHNANLNAQTMKQLYGAISKKSDSYLSGTNTENKAIISGEEVSTLSDKYSTVPYKVSNDVEDMITKMTGLLCKMEDAKLKDTAILNVVDSVLLPNSPCNKSSPKIFNSLSCKGDDSTISISVTQFQSHIDSKIKEAEERIVNKMEASISKSKEDIACRLDKIETMLSYLIDKHG